jgi:ribosomal protein S12 methylthiotransferase accessory factor
MRPFHSPDLLEALGVTRLARVTGMDRSGVEVFAAIRPDGHVLQVTQGKGASQRAAAWSAVGEAAELEAAEQVDPRRLVFCPGDALDGLVLDDDGLSRAWVDGRRLSDGARVWVAAERVFCPPAGRVWLGPSVRSWTSTGLGAHRSFGRAVRHAALEVWERHALAQALPGGWTPALVARSAVAWRSPEVARLEARGFRVVACVLAMRPLPLAGVLLFDVQEGAVPLTAGYACRFTAAEALTAALLEAAQTRLTEIHGARDDVAVGVREPGARLLEVRTRPARRPVPARRCSAVPSAVASRLVVVELRRSPLHVVKVAGIGLDESELLR